MFNFPYLKSLVEKNAHCRNLFTRIAQWEKNSKLSVNKRQQSETTRNSVLNQPTKNVQLEEVKNVAPVHWKKAVKMKFEEEGQVVLQEDIVEDDWMQWLPNWKLESSLQQMPTTVTSNNGKDGDIECKICDETFETRRQLSQHKRLEHFPSWEGGNKHFCYVPYFVEPKRFNLLRGTLAKEQYECISCKRWFGDDGVKQKLGPYLERLRVKVKSAATSSTEQIGNDTINNDGGCGKKRARKCKSMSRRVCELCSKILSNRKGLERHMLIHTGEKPFPCDICGKPFRRKDNCVRHKKTAHLFKKPRKPRCRKSKVSNVRTKNTGNVPPRSELKESIHVQ